VVSRPAPVAFGNRLVGAGQPVYVVAELSGNHLQDRSRAENLVRAAHAAGADAVKLQTYTADTMTIASDAEPFRIRGTSWDGRNLYELYREAHTPWDWQPRLFELARELGMQAFSTPFDATAVDFLEQLDPPVHKIASFEIVDLPLLRKVASTGRPVMLSTGMSTLAEIEEAVSTLRAHGAAGVVLLKCTSAYPARPENMHLGALQTLRMAFDAPVGLSDHTLDESVPVAAVALGAVVIEKHLTIDRKEGGPDASFSLEPDEFAQLVRAVRATEAALGGTAISPTASEEESLVFRRSLFVVEELNAGDTLTEQNIRVIRPGFGLHPRYLASVLGRRATRRVERGTPLAWGMFE
jgi:pseudaminic acid synthase